MDTVHTVARDKGIPAHYTIDYAHDECAECAALLASVLGSLALRPAPIRGASRGKCSVSAHRPRTIVPTGRLVWLTDGADR